MESSILIRYFLLQNKKQIEYTQRRKSLVPRIGELVRFNGKCYEVKTVVWVEDEPDVSERVHLEIEECQ